MKLFTPVILILCSFALYGQKTTIGKSFPLIDNASPYCYLRNGDEVLVVKRLGRGLTLQKFNVALELERAMQYENFPKDFVIEEVSKVGDAYYIFYSWTEKGKDYLSALEINFSRGELVGAERRIISSENLADDISTKFQFEEGPQVERGKYVFYYSQDSSKLAISYRLKPEINDDNKSYEVNGVWVYNDKLIEQWHGNIQLPYTEKKIDVYKRGVDSNGAFYFFIVKFKDNTTMTKKSGEDIPNYTLEMLAYPSASASVIITPINLGEKFIHSLSFNEHAGKVACSGYYNSGEKSADVEGIFTFTLNGDGTHSNTIKHPFSLTIINEGESKSFQEKSTKKSAKKIIEFTDLKLTATSIQSDGSLLIQGEQQRKNTSSYRGVAGATGSATYSSTSYNYENIVVAKLNENGSLSWLKKLRKAQEEGAYWNKAYKHLEGKNGKHYFIFMDTKKNIGLAPEEPVKSFNGESGAAIIAAYFINDRTGNVEKTVLAQMKDFNGQRIYEVYAFSILLSEKSIIFLGEVRISNGEMGSAQQYRKEEVLGKIELD